jgi:predicted HTH domain antitoxin
MMQRVKFQTLINSYWVIIVSLESVVDEFPLFNERVEKERFLLVLGLLASRTVTLGKAAEVMGMPLQEFSTLLRTIGFKYSYLDEKELKKELKASKSLLKKRCS